MPGSQLQLTYFRTDYKRRIEAPVSNSEDPLSDPLAVPFVVRNPTAQLVTSTISQAAVFQNYTGVDLDPSNVAAIVDDRYQNVSRQQASGVDALAQYRFGTKIGQFDWSADIAYLHLRQQLTATSGFQTLSGTVLAVCRLGCINIP
jgi:iron complex outermembrane recepter protein